MRNQLKFTSIATNTFGRLLTDTEMNSKTTRKKNKSKYFPITNRCNTINAIESNTKIQVFTEINIYVVVSNTRRTIFTGTVSCNKNKRKKIGYENNVNACVNRNVSCVTAAYDFFCAAEVATLHSCQSAQLFFFSFLLFCAASISIARHHAIAQ